MSDTPTPDFIPVMLPLAAAVFVESDTALNDDGTPYTAPIAILEFNENPVAELLFRDLVDVIGPIQCRVSIDTWFGMPEPDRSEQERQHDGHPLVRFVLLPDDDLPSAPAERLGFLVCAQCDALFFGELTQHDELAIGPTLPDGVSPDDPLLGTPDSAIGKYDPVDVAEAELWAWRNAYGDYTPQDLASESVTSGEIDE